MSVTSIEGDEIEVVVEETDIDVTIEDQPVEITLSTVGDQGPQGDPGQDGVTTVIHVGGLPSSYLHTQAVAAPVWHIVHGLGYYPAVSVLDNAGTLIQGGVQHLDLNTLEVSFYSNDAPLAFAGQASLT